jgi:hypothetical protein
MTSKRTPEQAATTEGAVHFKGFAELRRDEAVERVEVAERAQAVARLGETNAWKEYVSARDAARSTKDAVVRSVELINEAGAEYHNACEAYYEAETAFSDSRDKAAKDSA